MRVRLTIATVGNSKPIIRVPVVLVIRREIRMRRIVLSSVVHLVRPHLSSLSYKRYSRHEKKVVYKMCLIYSTTFVHNISHSKKNVTSYSYKYISIHAKCLFILSDYNLKTKFFDIN
jgi:hypothetical protein